MSTVKLLTNQPTNSLLEQSPPWDANSSSTSQEIPCILWNLNVQYSIHMNLLAVPVLNQNNPVHGSDQIPADPF
jgi:hypothetical protein